MTRAVLLLALVACGDSPVRPAAPPPVPRAATAGDALLALLPAGADAVAELDVARLRETGSVGALVAAVRKRATAGFDPLADIDLAVAGVYRLGADDAATVFVLRGARLHAAAVPDQVLSQSAWLDEQTLVVGPPAERARVGRPGGCCDAAFLTLRGSAMPARAPGALLRVTARLGRAARIAAAGRLVVDEVPATLSVWLDVADDVALVALLGGEDHADAVRLAALAESARDRVARLLPALAPHVLPAGDFTSTTGDRIAKITWLLGPRRLAAWVRETAKRLDGDKS